MKAKIDKDGNLSILRGPKYKSQYCPFTGDADYSPTCGDWCPLFVEPNKPWALNKNDIIELSLCRDDLSLDELIDERG